MSCTMFLPSLNPHKKACVLYYIIKYQNFVKLRSHSYLVFRAGIQNNIFTIFIITSHYNYHSLSSLKCLTFIKHLLLLSPLQFI